MTLNLLYLSLLNMYIWGHTETEYVCICLYKCLSVCDSSIDPSVCQPGISLLHCLLNTLYILYTQTWKRQFCCTTNIAARNDFLKNCAFLRHFYFFIYFFFKCHRKRKILCRYKNAASVT